MAIKAVTGKQIKAPRLFILGTPKVGKTSLAAGASKPCFIDLETGTVNLDVARIDQPPRTFEELLKLIDSFATEDHGFKTLVLDPVSRIEPMIWDVVLSAYNKTAKQPASSVPDIPFKRGLDAAVEHWRRLVAALERVWVAKNMTIICIDHVAIRNFKDPTAVADYQRIEPSVDRQAAALIQRWSDAVLFADFKVEVLVTEENKKKTAKALGVGERVLHTEHGAAHDGGNRYRLPSEMPLDWPTLAKAIRAGIEENQKAEEVTNAA